MADPSIRARNIGISQFAWSCGPAIIFTLGIIVSPLGLLGNRLLFLSLLIVAFVAWQLQRKLESKDWEAEQVKMKESGNRLEHPFKTAFSSMVNVKSVLFLVGVYLFWNLVAGAMGFFMPFVYETVGGLSNTQANLLQAVLWILTAASTYFGFAKFGDRVSHRGLFCRGFNGSCFLGCTYFCWNVLGWLMDICYFMGYFSRYWCTSFYALWSTELFPTKYRGGVQGVMFS